MTASFAPLTYPDLIELAADMRPIDRIEVDAMSGRKPIADVLQDLLLRSRRARAARYEGRLVMCYGMVAPTPLSIRGSPWALGTVEMERLEVRREFLRHAREQLLWAIGDLSVAWNAVHADNRDAIRWLKTVGFSFDDTLYLVGDAPFRRFVMEA